MAKTEITVDVKARLDIDEETAKMCLKMVEIYVNSKGKTIIAETRKDGEIGYRFM